MRDGVVMERLMRGLDDEESRMREDARKVAENMRTALDSSKPTGGSASPPRPILE